MSADLCDGCNVREPFEHRCHGGTCPCPECRVLDDELRAPVQAHWGTPPDRRRAGTVAWFEHEMAWREYHRHHPHQDAETIARRGGFGYREMTTLLGHEPTTWTPGGAR